ncbi:hypothetical protein [Nitrosomonas sp. Nm51]|uniref:hypothetical protein n=1 Tax=Nitrosomonas sp. Nm51 TaxID=133720 RepID=UPI00115FA540|nr:hypothetical protein [Nitrosomonas sp. Nm51]
MTVSSRMIALHGPLNTSVSARRTVVFLSAVLFIKHYRCVFMHELDHCLNNWKNTETIVRGLCRE